MAGSGAIGKPGDITSPNHGSSRSTICGESGSAVATAWAQATSGPARPAPRRRTRCRRRRRHGSATPERHRADELPLDRAPVALGRRPPRGTSACPEPVVVEVGDDRCHGSRRRTSTAMLPYWPSVTPSMPSRAWAIIPSAGERRGNVGIAGQVVLAQRERGRVVGVAVGKTADPGRRAGAQDAVEAAARRGDAVPGAARRFGASTSAHRDPVRPRPSPVYCAGPPARAAGRHVSPRRGCRRRLASAGCRPCHVR